MHVASVVDTPRIAVASPQLIVTRHASPMPFIFASFCDGFGTCGQSSVASGTPSPSASFDMASQKASPVVLTPTPHAQLAGTAVGAVGSWPSQVNVSPEAEPIGVRTNDGCVARSSGSLTIGTFGMSAAKYDVSVAVTR